jgi:hypothetical protein
MPAKFYFFVLFWGDGPIKMAHGAPPSKKEKKKKLELGRHPHLINKKKNNIITSFRLGGN